MLPVRKSEDRVPPQHFDLKMHVCLELLNAKTPSELVKEKVFPGKDPSGVTNHENIRLGDTIAGRFHKLKAHAPSNADTWLFWEALANKVGFAEGQQSRGRMLIEANPKQFLDGLPESVQGHAQQLAAHWAARNDFADVPQIPQTEAPISGSESDDGLHIVRLHHTGPVETIATGLRKGQIDQRHYYLDPDSAYNWTALVRADAYPTYDHCRLGLTALIENDSWRQVVNDSQPGTVVMLAGGGAPTKDLLLIRHLVEGQPQNRLTYYIFDISHWMVEDSLVFINKELKADDIRNVTAEGLVGDVLQLTSALRGRLHQRGRTIFGMTGGTLGNLPEGPFFRSLGNVAEVGDLLILSADTVDELPPESIAAELKRKYNHPALRRFLRPVIKTVLSEANSRVSWANALDRIKVDVQPSPESEVPGSWDVMVSLKVEGRDIKLVRSTRYKALELTTYAHRFGWEPVCQVPSLANKHYKQFAFRRKRTERTGTV